MNTAPNSQRKHPRLAPLVHRSTIWGHESLCRIYNHIVSLCMILHSLSRSAESKGTDNALH